MTSPFPAALRLLKAFIMAGLMVFIQNVYILCVIASVRLRTYVRTYVPVNAWLCISSDIKLLKGSKGQSDEADESIMTNLM